MSGKTSNPTQTIENLRGEIEFRGKLARQHVTGEVLFPDYYDMEEHNQILFERVQATFQKMSELKDLGVHFSPFLELGAERGQRSLVLTNDFSAEGVAIDISFHQLATTEHFTKLFHREKLPLRICCDANHLPFKNNSFPFIYCYQFLHHFPSPKPVMDEIFRVLSNGYFYFDEEPFKRVLKLNLYKQSTKIYSKRAFRKNKYVNLIEGFISEAYCDEVEHGIIENNDISLTEWSTALSIFDDYDVNLFSIYNITSKLGNRIHLGNVLNILLGGRIAGLCRKKTGVERNSQINLLNLLACPDCQIPSSNGSFDRPSLVELSGSYKCTQCGFTYPCKEGIIFLLPKDELQQLYPDV